MGFFDDVYFSPEKYGLIVVAEIDYSTGNYEFDLRVVWKHESGVLYTARDSGCSCPSPFENYNSLEDLEHLDYRALQREVAHELRSKWSKFGPLEARTFLHMVKEALDADV